jgi:hypothetical protein
MQAEPIQESPTQLSAGGYRLRIQIELPPLIPGRYTADLWLGSHYSATLDNVKNAIAVTIEHSPSVGRSFPHSADHGRIVPTSKCQFEKLKGRSLNYQPELDTYA